MKTARCKHVYGPVPSRRLGRSLGIDLVPFKTCTYDCVYCQIGRTTNKTIERKEYVPVAQALAELEMKLSEPDRPDFISLAGSGEPTLNSGIGMMISRIKEISDIPVAVLTNGSLLWMDEVRKAIALADVVMPSLDAGDERMFSYVNRPHGSITFDRMADGIVSFTKEFKGETWIEILLLSGVTGTVAESGKIAAITARARPARVQLNTVTRPPAEEWALPVHPEEMETIRNLFAGRTEIICETSRRPKNSGATFAALEEDVMALISRRPCTSEDIAAGLGIRLVETFKLVERLMNSGRAGMVVQGGRSFYYSESGQGEIAIGKENTR